MSKFITLLIMLLLSLTLALTGFAVRPSPLFNQNKPQEVEAQEDICEGITKDEDCLIRRTLAAHVDYIYTQRHKPKSKP